MRSDIVTFVTTGQIYSSALYRISGIIVDTYNKYLNKLFLEIANWRDLRFTEKGCASDHSIQTDSNSKCIYKTSLSLFDLDKRLHLKFFTRCFILASKAPGIKSPWTSPRLCKALIASKIRLQMYFNVFKSVPAIPRSFWSRLWFHFSVILVLRDPWYGFSNIA